VLFRLLSKIYFFIIGWKVEGEIPRNTKKYIVIGAPHTSYYDFPIGIATSKIVDMKIRYLAKRELFVFPIKYFLVKLGGIPVDRSKNSSTVDSMVEMFNQSKELICALSPEATRSAVNKWKMGFYYIAQGAKVPIQLVSLDYKKKVVGFGPLLFPSGDIEKDMAVIRDFYRDKSAKHPNRFDVKAITSE